MNLNEKQEIAKNTIDGPLLIIAGAGSGKTATLTTRVEYMIKEKGIDPKSLLCVTFTNKAAKEMRERIGKKLGVEIDNNIYRQRNLPLMGTFHSIGVFFLKEILGKYDVSQLGVNLKKDFLIYSEEDKLKVLKDIIVNDLKLDEKQFKARQIAYYISEAKNSFLTAKDYGSVVDSYIKEKVMDAYKIYEVKMTENNALDFDDILFKTLQLLKNPNILEYYQEKYKYIMVDEYQDTNLVQYEIVKLLASKYRNLAVVGDDWQCLTPETIIKTDTGEKEISKIIKGDKVLSYDGDQKEKYYEVNDIYTNKINEEIYEVETKSGTKIKASKNHIFFANPEDNNGDYEYAIYLMYKYNYGYRIGFTRYKGLKNYKNILGIRKRLNGERADYAWILQTTNDIKEAKYLEQLYSFKYGIPQTVFYTKGKLKELNQEDIDNIYKNIDTNKNVEKLFLDFKINNNYPHIIASSTNRFDNLRVNINFLMMGGNGKNRRFGMYRVTIHSSNEKVINLLTLNYPDLCRKSKLGIRIDKELANYNKIWELTQNIYKLLDSNGFNVLINERLSFLKQSYNFIPASNLRPGFGITIYDEEKGIYKNDIITNIKKENYNGLIYDLDINRTHNFVANSFVVHNSIYSWRGADMRNILNFKRDYTEAVVVKLEQNYRSTKHIIESANSVVKNNKTALEKTLWTDNEHGEKICLIEAPDDKLEASIVAKIIKEKVTNPPVINDAPLNKGELKGDSISKYSDNLILYRTNGQSRQIEEALMSEGIPYKVVGGLKFYDRKEVKDMLGYLRAIYNSNDVISFKRIINTPSRKIGSRTLEVLDIYKDNFSLPYFQILENVEEIEDLNNGAKRSVKEFFNLMLNFKENANRLEVADLLEYIIKKLDYKNYLTEEFGTEEAEGKMDNIKELINLATNYNGLGVAESLSQFLEEVSLVSDLDNPSPLPPLPEGEGNLGFVTMMTIHTSKGLEQKRVFIVGAEESIFPHIRSLENPKELEEERRLMYVAMTRAKKELYISRAHERFYFGNYVRNPISRFIKEIPKESIEDYKMEISNFSLGNSFSNMDGFSSGGSIIPKTKIKEFNDITDFAVGDKVSHHKFGNGLITSLTGEIAEIAFAGNGIKKMNIKIAPVKKV